MVNECGQLPQTSAAAASGGASPTDCSSPRSRPTNAFCIVDPLTASNRLSDSLKHIAIRFNGRRRGLPCAGAEAADGPADGGDRIADVGDAGVWIRAWRQKNRDSPCKRIESAETVTAGTGKLFAVVKTRPPNQVICRRLYRTNVNAMLIDPSTATLCHNFHRPYHPNRITRVSPPPARRRTDARSRRSRRRPRR